MCRETPQLERLGRIVETASLSKEVIESLADGRHSLVLAAKGQPPRLLLLDEGIDTDQDYASRAMWIDGVIICNDDKGIVRIVTNSSVTKVEGRRWMATALVFEAAEDILHVVPAADLAVVRRLLELCHHRISPGSVGTTIIYLLTDGPSLSIRVGIHTGEQPAGRRRDDGVRVEAMKISVLDTAHEPLVLHQARYRDGAMLVGHGGQLLAVNVILLSEKASEDAVPPMKGTRHTSAARHTYDCPDVLAFVVSADGPVTVFSDGKRIADLRGSDQLVPKTAERIAALLEHRREANGQGAHL